ncbi:MAG TPA: hypothetical protein VNI77_09825 [Nitrososphaera sp.]|nr:hypothetical protein [Nitrososphaera sp.]
MVPPLSKSNWSHLINKVPSFPDISIFPARYNALDNLFLSFAKDGGTCRVIMKPLVTNIFLKSFGYGTCIDAKPSRRNS